jgi:hypothetical protein
MISTRTSGVLTKLDKLETLFKPKTAWIQGAFVADEAGQSMDEDQVKSKWAAKWCLVGGMEKVGNGVQLFWELALTCEPALSKKVAHWHVEDVQDTKDEIEPYITEFNDKKSRQHKEILKAIRDTRTRVKKKGLTPLPKLRQEQAV